MFLALFLHLMAMVSHHVSRTTDPGVVPFKSVQLGKTKERYICEKTKGLKPTGSHFCSRVGRVVLRMDHFCPWTNNTVGIYTQKSYILFVTYTFMSCVLAVVSISSRFLSCRRSRLRRVLDDASGFLRGKLVLGLALELRLADEDGQHGRAGAHNVIAGDLGRLPVADQFAVGLEPAR